MARTNTNRLKLFIESDDELIDQFEYNWPILDTYADSILVADGVTPPDSDLYEGCLVAERTSGKLWMAVATPPGPPAYAKSYISYPWAVSAERVYPNNNTGLTDQTFTTFLSDNAINSSAAVDMPGGKLRAPINGIYGIHYRYGIPAVASRVLDGTLSFNGVSNSGTEAIETTSGIGTTQVQWAGNMYLTGGDLITFNVNWFGGGINLNLNVRAYMQLISPVWTA